MTRWLIGRPEVASTCAAITGAARSFIVVSR
jgi:hypothetical protein